MPYQEAVYYLATGIKNIINNSQVLLEKDKKGIIDGFVSARETLKSAFEENKFKRIGLFGGMSTGKSSLINILIGIDLLPVHKMQMSSAVIEIYNNNKHKENLFTIKISNNNDKIVQLKENISFEEAKNLIEDCGSHSNDSVSNNISKIKVMSNFQNSKILNNNVILVDTPGAEKEFENQNNNNQEEKNIIDDTKVKAVERNELDWEKTSKILDSIDIVLFLGSAKYFQKKNSKDFYNNYLKPNFDTLEILTHKDTQKQASEEDLQSEFADFIGCSKNKPVCISCKEWNNGKKTNNLELQKSSNIELLENKIIEKINQYTPEKYFYNCLNNIKQFLDESNELGEINGKKYGEKIFEDSQLEFYEFIKANSFNYSDIFISFISSILKSIFIEMSFRGFLEVVATHKNKLLSRRCSDKVLALAKDIYTKYHTNGIDC